MTKSASNYSHSVSAEEALQRLKEGNQRFIHNNRHNTFICPDTRKDLVNRAQTPFAIILSCSDSRAPAEIIFDQGIGDLFAIRVAGNIVAPSLVGSVEFAAASCGTPLVVVMGHTHCNAVLATLNVIRKRSHIESRNIHDIVDRIRPHIESLVKFNPPEDELLRESVRANIRASVYHLRHGSQLLEELVLNKQLTIIGAEYSLETGVVEFFDEF